MPTPHWDPTGGVGVHVVKKKVELYSRTSKRFVQILKTEVNARSEKGSRYGRNLLNYLICKDSQLQLTISVA